MAKGNIQVYIKKQLQKGISPGRIKVALSQAGYSKADINDAFKVMFPKKKLSPFVSRLAIIIVGIIIILLLFSLVQFLLPEKPIMTKRELVSEILGTHSVGYDPIFLQSKACTDECDFFLTEKLRDNCEISRNNYEIFKAIAEKNCPGNLGTIPLGEDEDNIIDGNIVCEGILTGNCGIYPEKQHRKHEEHFCKAYFDINDCVLFGEDEEYMMKQARETEEYANEVEVCRGEFAHLQVIIKAMRTKDPSLCDQMKPTTFDELVICRAYASNTCKQSLNQYINDYAITVLNKAYEIKTEGTCDDISIPELKAFCKDEQLSMPYFYDLRYSRELVR